MICDFWCFVYLIFCDFVIFVCDFFVISREVYAKKSVICPSVGAVPWAATRALKLKGKFTFSFHFFLLL